jgi:NitT/TauT family transport system ATP-binding protein
MDEPFAGVDALSRLTLQEDLAQFRVQNDSAYVMVTHDVGEAVFLGDQVVLLSARPGRVKHAFDVPWPKERSPHVRQTPRFAQLCNDILDGLREEIGAVGTMSPVRRTAVG